MSIIAIFSEIIGIFHYQLKTENRKLKNEKNINSPYINTYFSILLKQF